MHVALRRLMVRYRDRILSAASYWELAEKELAALAEGPRKRMGHACEFETSMMLALRPELVDLSKALNDGPARFKPYDRFPGPVAAVPASGVLSETKCASAEKGQWLLADAVGRIRQAVAEEFGQ
jgi:creatinine amidohydrolase